MSQPVPVAEDVSHVSNLLHEFAEKVTTLNAELLGVIRSGEYAQVKHAGQVAWLLDRVEAIRGPLPRVSSHAIQLLDRERYIDQEGEKLGPLAVHELSLRAAETETQLHHMLRLAHELRQAVERKGIYPAVAKLRAAAGLNAMKGGPLRPD